MAEQTGPPKATGEGEWPGSRKGICTRRGSLLEFGQELLLPEPVPSPLTGTLVLVTPIELCGDFKHISPFYGGHGYKTFRYC